MKKLFLLIVLFGVLAVGCEELFPTEQTPNITTVFNIDGENDYIIGAEGAEITVMVTTNIDYSVVIPEDAKDWLSVTTTRSETCEEMLAFVVAANNTFEERRAEVEFVDANGETLETISFIQDGQSKIFDIDSEDFYIFEPEGSSVTIDVTTNLEYSVVIDKNVQSWLSVADTRATLRDETLTFTAAPNDTDKIRYAFVELIDADNNVLQEIPFIQNAITQSDSSCPNDEIWYTNGSTTEATTPYATDVFGANIVSNTYDAEKECWVIKFDGEVTSIGKDAFYYRDSLTSVTIPDSVTFIGDCAFQSCSSLQKFNGKFASEDGRCLIIDGTLNSFAIGCGATEYTIPNSVTTIGDCAFSGCSSLTSITIPDSVTIIGNYAFCSCSNLTSVTIPDSVTTIGHGAFRNCESLTSVTIDNSVTEIGSDAFYDCRSLQEFNGKFASEDGRCLIIDGVLNSFAIGCGATEYTIPDSVTTIGGFAFGWCESLTSVTIPDSVTSIGDSAFLGCSNLQEFNGKFASEDSRCLIIDGVLNSFAIGCGATEYTIPDSVTSIGDDAFAYCSSLTSVTIPDSVTEIGYAAFWCCPSLTSVTIPDSVTTIGIYAFHGCRSLTSVYCKATTPPAGGSYMFYGNATGRKIYVPMESVKAYKSAKWWSEYADDIVGYNFETGEVTPSNTIPSNEIWYTNGSTTEATTPYATDVFGANIVSNTYNAEKECWVMKFDGDVATIGDYAFYYYCESLTSVTIPDSVTAIGDSAFYRCYSLTSVIIPDSVTTIGEWAFCDCYSLTSITIPDSVTTIRYSAFCGCSLTSITIPDSVTTIGGWAFAECYSLTSVTIPDSVTTIGDFAFYECSILTSVTIPDSVTTIGDGAFVGCSRLQEFNGKFASDDGRCLIIDGTLNAFAPAGLIEYTIPNSVTTIGDDAFQGCSSLTSVTIGDSVTTIGDDAFRGCSSLTSVTIPDSVTTIGEQAFRDCDSLTSVTIPDSVTTIGEQSFYNCRSLTSITIPDSVTTIGDLAFYECSSLTSVTIGDSVTTIGNYAFRLCSSLTSVYCKPTTPPAVTLDYYYDWCAFDENSSGRKIYVPAESVDAYKSAEGWSEYASDIVGYNF